MFSHLRHTEYRESFNRTITDMPSTSLGYGSFFIISCRYANTSSEEAQSARSSVGTGDLNTGS